MASARSEGRPGDDALITDTSIDDAVVDNENYAYWVFARIRVPASDCSLRTVRITYTVRSPLP